MNNRGTQLHVKGVVLVALVGIGLGTSFLLIEFQGFIEKLSPAIMLLGAFGALVASLLLFRPSLLMWLSTLLALVLVGTVGFFWGGEKLSWVSYGIAALLYLPAAAVLLSGETTLGGGFAGRELWFLLLLFVLTGLAGWSLELPSFRILAAVLKSWVMLGGVWAFLALYPLPTRWIRNWLYGLLGIAFLQWLPILYQAVALRIQRAAQGRYYSPDVVVGTFGGDPEGGGLTAVLAFFLVACSFIIIALARGGVLPRRRFWLVLGILVAPLLVVEVKAIFVYLPVGLFILYRDQLRARPMIFFLRSVLVAAILSSGIIAYNAIHWKGEEGITAHKFGYSFSTEPGYRAPDGKLTRLGAVFYWWESNGDQSLPRLITGYGFGSARTVGYAQGNVATEHFPMKLDTTGLSLLLWEVGIFGTLLWYLFLGAGFIMASRVTRSLLFGTWQHGLAWGLQAVIPMYGLSTFYRNDVPYAGPLMFLFMATFGLLFWLRRQAIFDRSLASCSV